MSVNSARCVVHVFGKINQTSCIFTAFKAKIKHEKFKNKNNQYVAIRSSAIEEDTENASNAGKFISELNVAIKKKDLIQSISKIIKNYKKIGIKKLFLKNQILIQEMVSSISMSGVIFTKDRENATNYYSINYDDITGLTDTVTSGSGEHSNKTIFIYRSAHKQLRLSLIHI